MNIKRLAVEVLHAAEECYLLAHGWVKVKEDCWREPKGRHPYVRELGHGHAVNSEKAQRRRVRRDQCGRCWQHYDDCMCS